MSKKASKTLIGGFVLGAVALMLAGVFVFGSGKFFRNTFKYVMFFQGSIKGLNIGAPVMFQGVKIGSVTEISLVYNSGDDSIYIPVIIDTAPEKISGITANRHPGDIENAVDRGLKAQLQIQSIVTGQLLVALDFFPDKPVRRIGLVKEYPEIPTVPTTLQELSKTIQDFPVRELFEKLNLAVDGIQRLVNSSDARESVAGLNQTLKDVQRLVNSLNTNIEPLMASLTKTSDTARETLARAEKTMDLREGPAAEVIANMNETLAAARHTLAQSEKTLSSIQGMMSQDSPVIAEFESTLRDLSDAARSVRALADYLERHPESLLRGKGASGRE
jgi:paraquat-inducible protein B